MIKTNYRPSCHHNVPFNHDHCFGFVPVYTIHKSCKNYVKEDFM